MFLLIKNSFPRGNVSMLEFLLGSHSVVIFVLEYMESDLKTKWNGSKFYIILVKKMKGCFSMLAHSNM